MFGPFVDKTDGITLKADATAITDCDHASTGIFLSKAGAAAAIRHATVTASVADAYGMMKVTLDATDTNTLGQLDVLFAKAATYLPVHKSFMILPANMWNSLCGTGGSIPDAVAGAAGGVFIAGANAATSITTALTANVIGNITGNLSGSAGSVTGLTAATVHNDLDDIQARLPAALTANGNMKSSMVEILTTALTETAGLLAGGFKKFFNIASPVSTMDVLARVTLTDTVTTYTGNTVQTGDNYARLGAPAGASVSADIAAAKVDTAAVKVQTDKLTFTVANQIDANVLDWKSATAPAMTGDAYARVGAPAGASVSADVAAVKVDTAAIKTKTDNLPGSPAAVGSAMALTSGERNSVADALLNRDMSTGTDDGSATVRTVRQALRFLRNKWSISGSTLTVTKEDDTTASWTSVVATTPGADPVTGSDPASS